MGSTGAKAVEILTSYASRWSKMMRGEEGERQGESKKTEAAPAAVNRREKMFVEKLNLGKHGRALVLALVILLPRKKKEKKKKGRVVTIWAFHSTGSLWSL